MSDRRKLGSKAQIRADKRYRNDQNAKARANRSKRTMGWLFTVLSLGGRR